MVHFCKMIIYLIKMLNFIKKNWLWLKPVWLNQWLKPDTRKNNSFIIFILFQAILLNTITHIRINQNKVI